MTTAAPTPPVRSTEPPKSAIRYFNPVIRALLRSPLHPLLDAQGLMLLTFTGRRTGRRFTIPVGYHELADGMWVLTGSQWRFNLRGGAPVVVRLRGADRPGRGTLVDDPDEVARVHLATLERVGLKSARRVGLELRDPRMPTLDEMRAATREKAAVRIDLD